jgi:H+/Na+-translocating ferredoxin:NAD+ oxidoreductase subunit E
VRKTTAQEDFLRGIWKENPVLVQLLGMCPTLAVTGTVDNAMVMGIATFFVLVGSSVLVATFKSVIPKEVRISGYILIIATFVQIADFATHALVPDIWKQLGPFVPLIVVNCIILGRQEAFASKNTVGRATLDAVGTGFGFIITMLIMGSAREIIGDGTWLGHPLFGHHYQPWVIMALPPGGFFTLGFVLLAIGWRKGRKAEAVRPRHWPHGVTSEVGGPV